MAIRFVFVCAAATCRRRYTAADLLRRPRFQFDAAAECVCGGTRFHIFVEPVPT